MSRFYFYQDVEMVRGARGRSGGSSVGSRSSLVWLCVKRFVNTRLPFAVLTKRLYRANLF